ncbi:MAG: M28 family peptidase [Nitrospirota bacterium]|nr:MAG: M28 family peptidase [Nitrospirota bacterium]
MRTVKILSSDIGVRSSFDLKELNRAAEFLTGEIEGLGMKAIYEEYDVSGKTYRNIIVELPGSRYPEKMLVVGAHYDTAPGTPGADDNSSGVAGLLEICRRLKEREFVTTVKLVFFTLEEPPYFRTGDMGSYRYARRLHKEGAEVTGMISLEMIGYFSDSRHSQSFPSSLFKWFYPDTGNFIMLVSDRSSKRFLRRVKKAFIKGTDLPVESISSYPIVTGVDFSDHWSFYQFGYDAIMVTDTSFYRNPHYHRISDKPDTLDYGRMTKVIDGTVAAIEDIAMTPAIK